MANLLLGVRRSNGFGNLDIAEPFAGGGGASLSLLFQEETPRIHLNDADPAIFDFWWTITRRPRPFLDMLNSVEVNMSEWQRQRSIYKKKSGISRLQRGFAAFFLNRCNRSGIIINGGPIGGVQQSGAWKLDARFNKDDLRRRCEKVAEFRDRVEVSGRDALDFIDSIDASKTLLFIDPPYFMKGSLLYLNLLNAEYHKKIADKMRSLQSSSWVMTYDDCTEIRALYSGWADIRPFSLRYAASERRKGREILITPKGLKLPETQDSLSIEW